jgi:putative transposase
MPHSFVSNYMHCVFSTKGRQLSITADLQKRLWPYLGGIARENKICPVIINGVEDHAHLLLALPSTISISKALQLIKGGSSKWIHETFPELSSFAWQEGYGAFGVSVSQLERTINYIKNQKEHHRTSTFQQEFVRFLKRHNLSYDERYVWD